MRPWLLLVALLLSDLSLLGDGDWITDYVCRPLCTKLLLSRLRAPTKELQTIWTRAIHSCPCLQKDCVCWTAQPSQRSLSFYWTNSVQYSNMDLTRIIRRILFSARAVASFCGPAKHLPAFRVKSNPLPVLYVINKPIHIAMAVIINRPHFWPPLLHHPSTIHPSSGRYFPAFLLEKSELNWALICDAGLQKMLAKGCCTAETMIIVCSSEDGEINSAMRIKKTWKQEVADPKTGQKEKSRQAMDLKDPMQPKIQRHTANLWHSTLQRCFWKQLSLKAAANKDADGVYVQGTPLLAPKKNKGSIYRSPDAIRPAADNEIEYFSKTLNTKESQLRSPQGQRRAENPKPNKEKNGNQQILAHRLQIQPTHKANQHGASGENMSSDVREETFIMLIPHAETAARAEPSKAADTGMRWETAKELGDPPPFVKSLKDFIGETGQSKCTCLVGKNSLLKLYLTDTAEMAGLKLAAKISEVTTESAATERTGASQENVAVDTTEEAKPTAEDSTIPSPASLKVTQTEATRAGSLTEATTTKTLIQDTTQVFGPSSTAGSQPSADQWLTTLPDPEPEADMEPRFIKCITVSTQATSKVQFSGLRMRDGVSATAAKPDKDRENDEKGPAKWAAADRKHGLVHRGGKSDTFPKSAEDARKEGADKDLKTELCRGLIDRTEAGWKHCEERRGAPPSQWETPDAGKLEKGAKSGSNQNPLSDEDPHFYYFNGLLKRVDNAQVYHKRQRRSFRATEKGLTERQRQTQENLQSYIQRLVKKNEAEAL